MVAYAHAQWIIGAKWSAYINGREQSDSHMASIRCKQQPTEKNQRKGRKQRMCNEALLFWSALENKQYSGDDFSHHPMVVGSFIVGCISSLEAESYNSFLSKTDHTTYYPLMLDHRYVDHRIET